MVVKQGNKLIDIIEHARKHSPFYNYLSDCLMKTSDFDTNLKSMQVLDRDIVVSNEQKIICDYYSGTAQKELLVNLTSGTTGAPLRVYWDKSDSLKSHLSLWRRRTRYYNITPVDKYCCLHTNTYSGSRIGEIEKIIYSADRTSISLCKLFQDEKSLLEYYNAICDFQPKWMFIQVSFLIKLLNVLDKNSLKLPDSIKYIELAGETVFDHDYQRIQAHIKCDIANMYGSMETNGIAYECPNHHLHIVSENVYVECLNCSGQHDKRGMSVITSLTNMAFPLIRYNLGDIISFNEDVGCDYSDEPVIKEIVGREKKLYISTKEETISESSIDFCIRKVVAELGDFLYEYRAELKAEGNLLIIVFVKPDFIEWQKSISDALHKSFNGMFPTINVTVRYENDYFNSNLNVKRTLL